MTTTIYNNGSKWAGEQPDSIEQLLEILGSYVLDRRFECGHGHTFISTCEAGEKWAVPSTTRFFGNFLTVSHVFSIDTDEPELIAKITAAIESNMARPDYVEQPSFEQREKAAAEYRAAQDARQQAELVRQAKSVLGLA